MRILTPPGVFRPISDTWMLAAHVRDEARGAVLDLCAGSGALAVAAARAGAERVSAVDVSRRSVAAVRLNAVLNRVRVRALRGDLLTPVAGERFDVIVSNPPYVPEAGQPSAPRRPGRAWRGGPDGRAVLDRVCAEAPAALAPGGVLLLVQSSVCGESRTLELLRSAGLEPHVAERRRGPLGPLLASRAAELEARGLLAPGQREEELLVIRAARGRGYARPE